MSFLPARSRTTMDIPSSSHPGRTPREATAFSFPEVASCREAPSSPRAPFFPAGLYCLVGYFDPALSIISPGEASFPKAPRSRLVPSSQPAHVFLEEPKSSLLVARGVEWRTVAQIPCPRIRGERSSLCICRQASMNTLSRVEKAALTMSLASFLLQD